jgi:putative transposase
MLKAYKYRIFPTDEQKQQLACFFGSCRFVYNLGLETKIQAWISAKKNYTCIDLANQMKELKDTEATWLGDCPSQTLQMSLRNLDNAYTMFFKGGGFPKFKNKYSKQSIQFPQGTKTNFNNSTIFLPKLKLVSVDFHREFKGDVKTVTVSKTTTNKYFVSILVDNQVDMPAKKQVKEKTTVGLDLGIKTLAVLSDGTVFENKKWLRKAKQNLRVQQRSLDRKKKVKGSNYEKQRLVVARLHEHTKNQREDYLHKISTSIIKKYDTVVLEDLNIKGMMANHKLAFAIGEIGWYKFNTMLEYKAEWYGKNIIRIGRFEPSSKCCSGCGTINKELLLKDRVWTCKNCGISHDRDVNASINIKKFGLRNKPSNANVGHLARA